MDNQVRKRLCQFEGATVLANGECCARSCLKNCNIPNSFEKFGKWATKRTQANLQSERLVWQRNLKRWKWPVLFLIVLDFRINRVHYDGFINLKQLNIYICFSFFKCKILIFRKYPIYYIFVKKHYNLKFLFILR